MKKTLLLIISIALSLGIYAQKKKRTTISEEMRNFSIVVPFEAPIDDATNLDCPVNYTVSAKYDENKIGNTFYDLQSNSTTSNRMIEFEDGTISAVWTRGITATAFPDRGTGYNYFDGSTWGAHPTERIEGERCGWPSISKWGSNGEIILCHSTDNPRLVINKRADKGTGTWEESYIEEPGILEGLVWPRILTSGNDNEIIHVITCTTPDALGGEAYEGQDPALLYYRSTDGAASWEIDKYLFPELNSTFYTNINADEYAWANPVGNTIAFVIADQWKDLILMKSDDAGDTWDKTVIWEHPYPLFAFPSTTVTDTFYCVDASASVVLDNTGKAHVSFGICRAGYFTTGETSYSLFPWIGAIGYWNEDMATFSNNLHALNIYDHPDSELVDDVSLVGWAQDVDGDGELTYISDPFPVSYRSIGLCTMPTLSIDPDNNIALAYSATTEGKDDGINDYKNIWARARMSDGTWTYPEDPLFKNLSSNLIHFFDECIYACFSPYSYNQDFNMIWQGDATPGLALDDDHTYQDNGMYHQNINLYDDLFVTSDNIDAIHNFTVDQNYPNPFTGVTTVKVSLEKADDVSIDVYDISGRIVYSVPAERVSKEKEFVIDGAQLETGVYFYNVRAGEGSITKKMIVK